MKTLATLLSGDLEDSINEQRHDIQGLFDAWKARNHAKVMQEVDQIMMAQANYIDSMYEEGQ